jgi:hypothetical protein
MSTHELIREIEEGGVRADLGLASTRSLLLSRLEANPTVRAARRHLQERPSDAALVLRHAVRLFEKPAHEGYAHPDDLILAAFLYILARVSGRGIETFLTRVRIEAKAEFYWSTHVAKYLASVVPATTRTQVAEAAFGFARFPLAQLVFNQTGVGALEQPASLVTSVSGNTSSGESRTGRHLSSRQERAYT